MTQEELIRKGYHIIRKPNDEHVYVSLTCEKCGKEMCVRSDYISKKTKLCQSCVSINNHHAKKHGGYKTRLYRIWLSLSHRNYNTYNPSVCEEWKNDFSVFREWALSNGYADNLTIDRINNKGNYEPSNCRWITQGENGRRARQIFSHEEMVKYYNLRKELKLTQVEMAHKLGVSRNTIQRLERKIRNECV